MLDNNYYLFITLKISLHRLIYIKANKLETPAFLLSSSSCFVFKQHIYTEICILKVSTTHFLTSYFFSILLKEVDHTNFHSNYCFCRKKFNYFYLLKYC